MSSGVRITCDLILLRPNVSPRWGRAKRPSLRRLTLSSNNVIKNVIKEVRITVVERPFRAASQCYLEGLQALWSSSAGAERTRSSQPGGYSNSHFALSPCHLHRPQHCARLILTFLELALRIGIRDDASSRL